MAATAGSVRAGGAFVELFAEGSKLDKGLQAASQKLKAWGSTVSSAGRTLFAGGFAGLTGLGAIGKSFASSGSEIADFAGRTGMGTDAIQGLKFGAEQTGADLESLETGVRKMQDTIANAAGGSKQATTALRGLGLSASDLAGLSPEEQFSRIADGLKNIPNSAQRTAAALDVLGKSGTQLVPLLSGGAEGLREFQQEAGRLGVIMPPGDIAAADELGDAIDKATSAFGGLKNTIGAAIAPALTDIANQIATVVGAASHWISENRGLVVAIGAGAVAATAAGAALIGLGTAITATGIVVGGFITAVGAIGSVLATIGTPLGVIVIWLTAGAMAWAMFTESGQMAMQTISDSVSSLGQIFGQTWGGILNALKAGDLKLAADVAFAGLKTAFYSILVAIQDRFGKWLVDMAVKLSDWAIEAQNFLPKAFGGLGLDPVGVGVLKGATGGAIRDRLEGLMKDNAEGFADAQEELDDAVKRADDAAKAAEERRQKAPGGKGTTAPFRPPSVDSVDKSKTSAVGTFSSAVASRFGGVTKFGQLETHAKTTAENTKRTADAVEDMRDNGGAEWGT